MRTEQRSTSSSTDPPAPGEVVLGVDTHGEVHVAAVVSPLGKVLGTESFPATAAGYRRLLTWARKLGKVRRAGVEGTGTFGAALSRYLLAQQIQVFEVNRPDRSARRLLGKSARSTRRPPREPCSAVAPGPGRNPAAVRCTAPGSTNSPRTPRSRPAPRRSTSSRPS
ncbi:IS110 family transposase [Streptomyces sp. RB17]|uniref:IS110 family transposase n=1 Tax=Streptomyces sp. RB17 TaxID=2585197 RepID=UPI002B1EE33A|nr:transposase [Streptomyces sp. RB17]